jgi:hypothetical protein
MHSFQDEIDAREYWRHHEWKKWAVDITAGPVKRPTFGYTMYVRARTSESAIECAQLNRGILRAASCKLRYIARLAGPRELGCVPSPPNPAHTESVE